MAASKLKRISISVSAEERASIELGAAIAGISLARFVVDAGLRAAEGALQNAVSHEESPEIQAQLKTLALGNAEIDAGKVKPVDQVVVRLRSKQRGK